MIREEGRCGEVGYVMMWCREAWCTHVDVLVLVPQEEVVQNTSFVQVSKSDLWGRRTEEEVFTNQVTWDSSPIPHRKITGYIQGYIVMFALEPMKWKTNMIM